MKRSLLRLCQSREKAAGSSSYQGVVCEADAASVASQDVFKVRAEGSGGSAGAEGWVAGVGVRAQPRGSRACQRHLVVPETGAHVSALGQGGVKMEGEVGESVQGLWRQLGKLGVLETFSSQRPLSPHSSVDP